jgi:hypothetical protein
VQKQCCTGYQLKNERQNCANIKRERNPFVLRAQSSAAEAMRKERDYLKLVVDNLRAQRYDLSLQEKQLNVIENCDIAKERDSLYSNVQHVGMNRSYRGGIRRR